MQITASCLTPLCWTSYATQWTTVPMTGGHQYPSGTAHGSRGGKGWQEEVDYFRQEYIYWHNVWLREGRQNHGWFHKTMVWKRIQYQYSVRLKRGADLISAKQLFESSLLMMHYSMNLTSYLIYWLRYWIVQFAWHHNCHNTCLCISASVKELLESSTRYFFLTEL